MDGRVGPRWTQADTQHSAGLPESRPQTEGRESVIPGYTKLAVIGRGAGSQIFKVRNSRSGEWFALKQVLRGDDPDGKFFEQTEAEARVGLAVQHPQVRRILEMHRVRRRLRVVALYLRMEYVEAQTLEQQRVSDLRLLVRLFGQIALGLQAIHQAGYVHADIKPGNILVTPEPMVKIIDLGQSCSLGTVKQRIQGTPDFIAPEQVMRLPLSERTDVFNLGATLYWCLTGKPFPTRLRSQQRAGSFDIGSPSVAPTPQECNPKVPGILSNLVMDCCRNSPASRPPDMPAVRDRLQAVEKAVKLIER